MCSHAFVKRGARPVTSEYLAEALKLINVGRVMTLCTAGDAVESVKHRNSGCHRVAPQSGILI